MDWDRGTTVSAIGHAGLILWIVLGDWLFAPSDVPEMQVAQVSLVSAQEFNAIVAAAPKAAKPAAKPEQAPAKPRVEAPDPVQPDLPAVDLAPESAVLPEVDPTVPVSPDPQPIDAPEPVAPLASEEQSIPVPVPTKRPKPRPIDRVASTPVDNATDAPDLAEAPTPETTDQPAPDAPVEQTPQTEASPEEATTQIVTEAVDTEDDAPQLDALSSRRPKSRPENLTQKAAATAEVAVETPATDLPAPEADAIAAALAEATAEGAPAEDAPAEDVPAEAEGQDPPAGPPMTAGEMDAIRVAVMQCWNLGALSSDALRTTVVVQVDVQENGMPDVASIRMSGYEGGSDTSAQMMFEVARRAIIRCGKNGFPLPQEKYDQWKELELVFDPNGMRMR